MLADTIKSTLSMTDVCAHFGFIPNRAGFIPCPFHADKTASMKIYPEPGRGFCCFGCGKAGSVIDFVMALLKIDYPAALKTLAGLYGFSDDPYNPDAERRLKAERAERKRMERDRQRELNRLSAEYCRMWKTMQTATEWTDELVEACQNIATVGYRIEEMER